MTWRTLAGWLCIGLFLRLLLLPVAVHPDTLATYDRIRQMGDGVLQWYDFQLQALPMAVHWLWSKIALIVPPCMDGLQSTRTSVDAAYQLAIRELSRPGVLFQLALWKLPYVLADLGCGVLVSRLVPAAFNKSALRLWMVHPFVLYVIVLFGKYESLMLLPLLAGLWTLKNRRPGTGFLWIGIAVAMRIYPAILLLPMALAADRSPRRRIELLLLSLMPTAVVLLCCASKQLASWVVIPLAFLATKELYLRVRGGRWEWLYWSALTAGLLALAPAVTASLTNRNYPVRPLFDHSSYLFQNRLALSSSDAILLFLLAFGLVCAWAHRVAVERIDATRLFDDVADAALLTSLAFVAFSFFNPQYALLLVPLVVIRLHALRDGPACHALQAIGLFLCLFLFRGGSTTTWLFLPLAPEEVAATGAPLELLPDWLKAIPWASVGRTMLILAAGWMTFDLLRWRRRSPAERGSVGSGSRRAWWPVAAGFLVWPVGLAGLLFFSLSATTLRATGDEWRSPPWNAARPLDGIDLAIEEELPSTLQVRLEEGVLSIPGHVVTLRRLGAGEAASGASPAADDIVLCIPPSALIPDAHGVMEVDLSALPLKPHTHYALTWEQRDLQAAPRANVRLLRPLARGELVTSFLRHARERLFGSGFGTIAWLLGLAVLLLGGAGLLMHDGRDVDGSSLRI